MQSHSHLLSAADDVLSATSSTASPASSAVTMVLFPAKADVKEDGTVSFDVSCIQIWMLNKHLNNRAFLKKEVPFIS